MAGWHHWLDGHESEWTPGVGDGQGGLACCDSWGRKESDTTERLIWSEAENGNPLQNSCLRNPMDGGTWWATVRGVTKELDMTKRLNNKIILSTCWWSGRYALLPYLKMSCTPLSNYYQLDFYMNQFFYWWLHYVKVLNAIFSFLYLWFEYVVMWHVKHLVRYPVEIGDLYI